MLTERLVLQASSDRFLVGAQPLLCKYTLCQVSICSPRHVAPARPFRFAASREVLGERVVELENRRRPAAERGGFGMFLVVLFSELLRPFLGEISTKGSPAD